jgi:hypothetical protein
MNIYLDIDGTILDRDGTPADGLHEFLQTVTKKHTCYWLTTHCRREGDIDHVHEYLGSRLPPETFELVKSIRPTFWNVLKTEAVDFAEKFLWFDDSVMQAESNQLMAKGAIENLRMVDLSANDELQKIAITVQQL